MAPFQVVTSRIESIKDILTIIFGIGIILQSLAILLLVPFFTALFFNEHYAATVFFLCAIGTYMLGIIIKIFKQKQQFHIGHLILFVPLAYLFVCLISAIPISLLQGLTYIDAIFEAMSGITTTGLTMITHVEGSLHSVLLFRSLLQYCGGLGIIIFSLAATLHPSTGDTRRFYLAEGRKEYLAPNIQKTIKSLWLIYLFYFILGVGLLMWAGMDWFDAVNHSMTGVGTGGFSTKDTSIQFFNNISVERIMMLLMVIGAIGLPIHYALFTGKIKEWFKNIELRTGFFIMASGLCIIMLVFLKKGYSFAYFTRYGAFQLVSTLTGSGFHNINPIVYLAWPILPLFLMILFMSLGGSTGSTSGGIKWFRIGIFTKAAFWKVRSLLYPGINFPKKVWHLRERIITPDLISKIGIFMFLYALLFSLSVCAMLFHGYELQESLFESSSALGTVGLSAGVTQPSMPLAIKIIFIINMWAGRLEILPVIALLLKFIE